MYLQARAHGYRQLTIVRLRTITTRILKHHDTRLRSITIYACKRYDTSVEASRSTPSCGRACENVFVCWALMTHGLGSLEILKFIPSKYDQQLCLQMQSTLHIPSPALMHRHARAVN